MGPRWKARALIVGGTATGWLIITAAAASADTCSIKERSASHCENTAWVPGVFTAAGGAITATTIVRGKPGAKTDKTECGILASKYRSAVNEYRARLVSAATELDQIVTELRTLYGERRKAVEEINALDIKIGELTANMLAIASGLFALEAGGAFAVKASAVGVLWGMNTPKGKAALEAVRAALGILRAARTGEAAAAGATAGGSTLGPLGALGGAIAAVLTIAVVENVEKYVGDYMTAEKIKELNARHTTLQQQVQEAASNAQTLKAQLQGQAQRADELKQRYDTRYNAQERELDALHQGAMQALNAYFTAGCGSRYPLPDLPERAPREKADLRDPNESQMMRFMKWIGAIK